MFVDVAQSVDLREVDHVNYHEITGQFIFSLLSSRENKRLVDIHVVMGKMKQMRE